jgi:nitrile hydratase accessory protein
MNKEDMRMSQNSSALVKTIEDTMKLPRENGELVFKTPWEGRAFAMAVLMTEKGIYPWKDFNGKFVKEIGDAESSQPGAEMLSSYYRHWVQAFEKVLLETAVFTPMQLKTRTEEFASGKRHHVC